MSHYATCSRRFGRFHIDADLVMDMHPAVTRIMGMCTILRAEHNLASNAVEYQALCFKFKPIAQGTIMPEYQWVFYEDGSVEAEIVPAWGVAAALQAPANSGTAGDTSCDHIFHAHLPLPHGTASAYCIKCGHVPTWAASLSSEAHLGG